jgi:uncharacterized protein YdhG (YjbR/CyaY superfamily)
MITDMQAPKNVDEYIAGFPENVQAILGKLRNTVIKAAPEAEEIISYRMPAYKLNGILVYFAAFKNHISFFPTTSGIEVFRKELSAYKCSKGTVQFPLKGQLPWDLITAIVKFRVKENLQKAARMQIG